MQETRILRDRNASADAAYDASQAGGDPEGSSAILLVTTKVGAYPTVASAFYACNPASAGGAESEGGSASLVADTSTVVYALNLGTSVPPQGTYVVGHGVGGRTTFRFDG